MKQMNSVYSVFKPILYGCLVILTLLNASCSDKDKYTAYLFAYFIGNGPGEEAIFYAVSPDGFNYVALNNNRPVIAADTISSRGGVRDPHILRAPDGKFYMVVTDLFVSNDGWSNNQAMVFLKSDDLINWTHSVVNVSELFPNFHDVRRVWAPQSYFDEEEGKIMVYFSMLQPGGYDIIYYAYANEDFTSLETEPKQLFFHPENRSCIDGDIVKKDGQYHLFFKTEGHGNGIKKAVSDRLTEGYVMHDEYLQQTNEAVEGSCVFKLIDSDTYILMYDVYIRGEYQFTQSTDLKNFTVIDDEISMNFRPRHGTVIPITQRELESLINKWGTAGDLGIASVTGENVKTNNVVIHRDNGTIYVPVKYGTDLSSFEPVFESFFDARIRPTGPQDFSQGPVEYTVSVKGLTDKKFNVTVKVDNNPVLTGYYADPEIIWSEKHQKFYLYPTSDGYHGWSGNYFKAFSSTDLVNWIDEGVILDLVEDVPWGPRNAWAPAMIEKKMGDTYKYFYYFTAAQKIGVAVSDHPAGRFEDIGEPLIDWKPDRVRGGQEIDPDVFTDPVSGNDYLYWGNGYLAGAKLNEDMISIDKSTVKVMTPVCGTFREGIEVFYRNGKYYFLWSENDTRSEDYRVRYAMSDSPMGEFYIPENNLVIAKDPSKGIYGTGHNCVIQIPGRDEWYIIYHRFTRPEGITMGGNAGFHRETCIDRMTFDENGYIIRVQPTLEGIDPVSL
ncbi:family 43 glycosylhydrolase [Natronoflexus pectinivorans]|uniref:Glycosyl hydrolase family 43 n=1 Tax=Natronoflexus pectinivorans TaxID=682526 RepID=A0A4R2GJI6_9BACT|nr:family 43 glycosylhydrolase [Natronoflexus pectinivorans]TCO08840.1 glycosyl hydrolase family 43 [Natronoflexus pectinivorans]